MALTTRQIIARYEIPVIGTYEIDEGLTCLLNNKEFAYCTSIDEAKEKIRDSVGNQMKRKVEDLQKDLNTIQEINVGLLDEKYRIQAFKD